MLKSIYKVSGFMAVMAWSGMVCATGLGGINVSSNLGQPLKAEIELVSVDKADRSSIAAKLASADAFKNAGVDYPYSLPKLKFEVINRESGDPTIKLTSSQPVNEPFVTLLIEVTWSTGKLLREYTFLLDPADFKAQEPQVQPVQPIAPVISAPAPVADIPPAVQPAATSALAESSPIAPIATQPEPAPEPVQTAPAEVAPVQTSPVEAVPVEPAPVQPVQAEKIEVIPHTSDDAKAKEDALSIEEAIPLDDAGQPIKTVRGDTLSKIALQNKPADVSLERMLVALYRANADAFAGKNMNRLKTGKIIRLPDAADLESLQQSEAVKEVRAQVADWNVYRQQLAATRTEATGDAAGRQVSSGKVSTAVAESAPAAKDSAKEVLKLSKGEAPGDKAAAAGKASAQEKANAKAEEAIAKAKALKEAQERTALLEKNVKDLQRLAELKAQAANAASAPSVASGNAASAVAVAPKPKVTAPVAPPIVVEQPSLVDEILEDPVMLGGIAGVVLVLAGVGFMLARRGKKTVSKAKPKQEVESEEDAGATTGRIATPVMPSPDTGDFTQTAVTETTVLNAADEVDPIGEADLFLTFGRDVQAEEVLTEALKSNPGNVPVRLKLMSIYAGRKDSNAFYTHALVIKESGDESAWNQAVAMGQALEPGNPLYGGTVAVQVTEQVADTAQPSVDFDLGFGSSTPEPVAPDFQGTVVLETPSNESTTILSASDLRAAQEIPMDFDITGTHPGVPAAGSEAETAHTNADDSIFDITSAASGVAPVDEQASKSAMSSAMSMDDMVFDITANPPSATVESAPKLPEAANMDDLIFDITSSHSPVPAAAKPATTPAVSSTEDTMAFTLDFPTEFKSEPAAKAVAPIDIGLGDISLNLDNLVSTAATSAGDSKDEHWQEVATKLDLAKAYQEMGDAAGAKEILDEVLRDGDDEQRASAEAMLQQL